MTIKMTFRLTDDQLADALMKTLIERLAKAGNCDVFNYPDKVLCEMNWTTKGNATYLGKTEVSRDKTVGALVDAYNILKYGKSKCS